ncbi:MAG TPA: hypothetical protein VJH65_01740 [Candidatus Nanoarchaeia archaeon]|nr:hypothetical protein [Candidatus Nanoarchaeia archaeon]
MSGNELKCPKCNGTGVIKDKKGTCVCYDCLIEGKLDVHSKKVPDSNIKI